MTKSQNQIAIEAFAAHFQPALQVVATRNIGGSPVHDGWMCALHIPELEIGFTATAWGKGYFKAWVEVTGLVADAAEVAALVKGCLILANARQKAQGSAQTAENLPATQVPESSSSAATDERRDDLSDPSGNLAEMAKEPSLLAKIPGDTAERIAERNQILQAEGKSLGLCEHDFQYGAAGIDPEGNPYPGVRRRCWKCGVQEPKLTPPASDATKADAATSETAAQ